MALLSSLVIIFSFPFLGLAQPVISEKVEKVEKDALLTILLPAISTAITGYYGKPRQYGLYDADILSLTRIVNEGQYTFKVKVLVRTFVGPHNPPYGNEIVTLTIDPSGIHVEEFIHRDE